MMPKPMTDIDAMLMDLHGGSLGVTTDGVWIFQTDSGFGDSFTGSTPTEAITAAWDARV